MNQNIRLMPERKAIESLFTLTQNLTQTTAHHRYSSQKICDKWNIPLHHFSVYIPDPEYQRYSFEEKEKTVVLSPDENEYKNVVIENLKKDLPDFKLFTVHSLSYAQYWKLISRSFCTVTFGEGFDGYFSTPIMAGSLGFAVYNDEFFPNKKWEKMANVYSNYKDMVDNISNDIKVLSRDKNRYLDIVKEGRQQIESLYSLDRFCDNLKRFYNQQYDLYPS